MHPKGEIIFDTLSNYNFFQYCYRNIVLFSIGYISSNFIMANVVDFDSITYFIFVSVLYIDIAPLLYCSPYSYCSFNYCDSYTTIKRATKNRSKELILRIKQKILEFNNFIRNYTKISNIITQYWKNKQSHSTKICSHFSSLCGHHNNFRRL